MANNNLFRGDSVRKYLANLFLGLCVIGAGIGYLGNYLEFLPWTGFTLFFPGWGALFLIIPALYNLIRFPFSWFWPICLLGGLLIVVSKSDLYPMETAVAICLAVMIILVGIRIVLAPLFRKARRRRVQRKVREQLGSTGIVFHDTVDESGADGSNYSVSFGERSIHLEGQDFTSATLSVSFGEMQFDLSDARITDCAVIDANCAFGELSIKAPDYVRVEVTKGGAFSGISCKHNGPRGEGAPVLYVNANCSFGEITIR